jgi:hypothetical protein
VLDALDVFETLDVLDALAVLDALDVFETLAVVLDALDVFETLDVLDALELGSEALELGLDALEVLDALELGLDALEVFDASMMLEAFDPLLEALELSELADSAGEGPPASSKTITTRAAPANTANVFLSGDQMCDMILLPLRSLPFVGVVNVDLIV